MVHREVEHARGEARQVVVKPLRYAEANGRYDAIFAQLNTLSFEPQLT